METSSTMSLFGDNAAMMLSVLIFLAAGTLAFAVMIGMRARGAVRRRAATVGVEDGAAGANTAQKLVAYATKHYASADSADVKVLRRRLIAAGIYDPHGATYFFMARAGMAVGLAAAAFFALPLLGLEAKTSFWLFLICGGLLGYLIPGLYLDRRVKARR